jgi:hypothetical protein
MMLLYGFLRGISAILRRAAEWKHGRTQNAYECAETAFGELESSCKAEEVALGRPLDYALQLRLLKAYERREVAKERWVRAAERMNRRKDADGKVRSLSEMRLPYTFGLIDMAFILRLLDNLGILPQFEQPLLEGLYTVLFN